MLKIVLYKNKKQRIFSKVRAFLAKSSNLAGRQW